MAAHYDKLAISGSVTHHQTFTECGYNHIGTGDTKSPIISGLTQWSGYLAFSPEFTRSTTLRACPERSRTGQALSEAEWGSVEETLFWFPIFAFGENWEPKTEKVPLCRRRKRSVNDPLCKSYSCTL